MARAEWTLTADVEDERPLTARRIVEEIQHKAEIYASTPGIGQRHPDLPEDWWYFRHKRWIVVYRHREYGIDVLRVVDASRDFPRLFP